jgi:predicted nucleic-acid-binding Zn-ribbon protein
MVTENELERLPDAKIDCPRCGTTMKNAGRKTFHEGRRMGAIGQIGELMVNQMQFDVIICPACGKTEFFF